MSNNNISIQSIIGKDNFADSISVNDLAQQIRNEPKDPIYNIRDIIEIQEKNKKQKQHKYESMYKQLLNLIYQRTVNHESTMIYTIPYMTDLKEYDYEEYKTYIINKLTEQNIAITSLKKYNPNVQDNQYIITWRFIGCKR